MRSNGYISLINSGMLLFLLLSRFQDQGLSINLKRWFIPLTIVSFALLIGLGYIDRKAGFFQEEQAQRTLFNPIFNEMYQDIKQIKETIKDGEE